MSETITIKFYKIRKREIHDIKSSADINILINNIRVLIKYNITDEERLWLNYLYKRINPKDIESLENCSPMSDFVKNMNAFDYNKICDKLTSIYIKYSNSIDSNEIQRNE